MNHWQGCPGGDGPYCPTCGTTRGAPANKPVKLPRLSAASTARLALALSTVDRFKVREIAMRAGIGLHAASTALHGARDLGLVDFEDGKDGTHRSRLTSNACATMGSGAGGRGNDLTAPERITTTDGDSAL